MTAREDFAPISSKTAGDILALLGELRSVPAYTTPSSSPAFASATSPRRTPKPERTWPVPTPVQIAQVAR